MYGHVVRPDLLHHLIDLLRVEGRDVKPAAVLHHRAGIAADRRGERALGGEAGLGRVRGVRLADAERTVVIPSAAERGVVIHAVRNELLDRGVHRQREFVRTGLDACGLTRLPVRPRLMYDLVPAGRRGSGDRHLDICDLGPPRHRDLHVASRRSHVVDGDCLGAAIRERVLVAGSPSGSTHIISDKGERGNSDGAQEHQQQCS